VGGHPSRAAVRTGSKRWRPSKSRASNAAGIATEAAHCIWHSAEQQRQRRSASDVAAAWAAVFIADAWIGAGCACSAGSWQGCADAPEVKETTARSTRVEMSEKHQRIADR
jgi:hypothetical protein